MKISSTVEIYCPSGFYCIRNGKNKCYRLKFHESTNRHYCTLFNPYLETDGKGNVLKCEACVLAEREARANE